MNIRKISIYLIILAITGGLVASISFTNNRKNQFLSQAQEFYSKKVKTEKKALWDEIKKEFKVDLRNLEHKPLTQHQTTYDNNDPIIKIVHEVAQEFNFDISGVEIVLENSHKGTLAYTTELNQLIIEVRLFAQLPEQLQKFVVAHELHHIFNYDFQEAQELEKALKDLTLTPEQQDLIARYDRFQENQADICAALKGTYWAESYLAFANEGIKRAPVDPGTTHPTFQQRAQLAQTILDTMHTGVQTA